MPAFLSPNQFPLISLPKGKDSSKSRFHWIWLVLGCSAAIAVFALGTLSRRRSNKPAVVGPVEGKTNAPAMPAPKPEALSSVPDSTMPESKTSKSRNAAPTAGRSQPKPEKVQSEAALTSPLRGEESQDAAPKYDQQNLLNLNKATAGQLELLPGVGPAMAERILAAREEKGGFKAIDDLGEVPGIGEKTMDKLRPLVTVT